MNINEEYPVTDPQLVSMHACTITHGAIEDRLDSLGWTLTEDDYERVVNLLDEYIHVNLGRIVLELVTNNDMSVHNYTPPSPHLRNPVEEMIQTYQIAKHSINVYSVYETEDEVAKRKPAYFNLNFADTGECLTEFDIIYPTDIKGTAPSYEEVWEYVENYLNDCE